MKQPTLEQFVLRDKGIVTLNLEADYRELQVTEWSSDSIPKDCYFINDNMTMSVLRYIKRSDNYESLWCLSFSLECKLSGRLSRKVGNYNLWCNKCRTETTHYDFEGLNIYKAIGTGSTSRCIRCTDSQLKFSQHHKFRHIYQFNKHGINYVNKHINTYYIFSEDKYTMLELNNYPIKYHSPLVKKFPETHEYYNIERIRCTVCGKQDIYEWLHNRTCIKKMNEFCVQTYNYANLSFRTVNELPDDIKNLIIRNLINLITY